MSYSKLLIKIIVSVTLSFSLFLCTVSAQDQPNEQISDDTLFVMQKSPWGAVGRSAILPGWGQFYNESYFKIPIIWGIGALLAAGWIENNNLYQDNRELFSETDIEIYRQRRDFYRDQRDNFTIYLVILYLLNLVDAYVDAHLFDFSVEEDVNNINARINFKLDF